jgi:hypothetical protein
VNFDLLALFQLKGVNDGSRQANRKAIAPF